ARARSRCGVRAGARRRSAVPDRLPRHAGAGGARPDRSEAARRRAGASPLDTARAAFSVAAGAAVRGGRRVRALILSWEYPPLIEGGLARHVRKLSENLAALGADVHVLTRGREESPPEEVRNGVALHRVR